MSGSGHRGSRASASLRWGRLSLVATISFVESSRQIEELVKVAEAAARTGLVAPRATAPNTFVRASSLKIRTKAGSSQPTSWAGSDTSDGFDTLHDPHACSLVRTR